MPGPVLGTSYILPIILMIVFKVDDILSNQLMKEIDREVNTWPQASWTVAELGSEPGPLGVSVPNSSPLGRAAHICFLSLSVSFLMPELT